MHIMISRQGIAAVFLACCFCNIAAVSHASMDRSLLNPCESPALPTGQFHIILVGHEEKTCFTHYLWEMGATNAHVFVYRRVVSERPLKKWNGPCGMEIEERLLLPNYGKDLSAFHSYVVEHYQNPPLAVALIHAHGPHGYHNDCEGIVGRVRFSYRGLASPAGLTDAAEFSTHMVTLTKVGEEPFDGGLNFLRGHQTNGVSDLSRKLHESGQLPEDEQRVIDSCMPIFDKWRVNTNADAFWSCCASFVLPWDRIRRYPKGFYREAYEHSVQDKWDHYWTSRHCWEYLIWKWYEEPPLTPRMRELYGNALNLARGLNLTRCQQQLDTC